MSILEQLELNDSVFMLFVIFGFAFFFLSTMVFGPYTKALEARESRTKGGEEKTQEYQKQTADLRARYETAARDVATQIKSIFDQQRSVAQKDYEKIVGNARNESQKLVEEARRRVVTEVADVSRKLSEEVPQVASAMVQKLLQR